METIARLHYITNTNDRFNTIEQVGAVVAAGARWIQFRRKKITDSTFKKEAILAMKVAKENNATFIINDRVSIAKALNADGVHLGGGDMDPLRAREVLGEGKIIGCTANTFEDILRLNTLPINYIGLGPYRHTLTKEKLSPILGLSGYAEILQKVAKHNIHIPIIAIGGILQEDLAHLFKIGIHGIALSGAIANSVTPQILCNNILKEIDLHL